MNPKFYKRLSKLAAICVGLVFYALFEFLTSNPSIFGFYQPCLLDALSKSPDFVIWQDSLSFSQIAVTLNLISSFIWSAFFCILLAIFQLRFNWLKSHSHIVSLGVLLGIIPRWLLIWLYRDVGSQMQNQYAMFSELMVNYVVWFIPLLVVLLLTNSVVRKMVP